MARFKSKLDNVRVAAPCNVGWDTMYGNERVRFCDQCQLNVYNLSEMTRTEAEKLIGKAEGRLCVRYYRRRDGSILTQNCPVGLRALKRRLSRVASAVASTVLSFAAGLGVFGLINRSRTAVMGGAYVDHVQGDVVMDLPDDFVPSMRQLVYTSDVQMGKIAFTPTPHKKVRRGR